MITLERMVKTDDFSVGMESTPFDEIQFTTVCPECGKRKLVSGAKLCKAIREGFDVNNGGFYCADCKELAEARTSISVLIEIFRNESERFDAVGEITGSEAVKDFAKALSAAAFSAIEVETAGIKGRPENRFTNKDRGEDQKATEEQLRRACVSIGMVLGKSLADGLRKRAEQRAKESTES